MEAVAGAASAGARYESLLDLIGNTPLVRLRRMSPREGVRIWAKLEGQNPSGSVKDRIAQAMLAAARADGSLATGQTILEPTSGNTGLSLAMIGRLYGHPVRCVMPESVSHERRDLLRFYGAELVLSPGDLGTNGAIKLAQELYAQDPSVFMPMQYENADNPGAHYRTTGPEVLRDCPDITHFVAGARHRRHADRRRPLPQGAQARGEDRRRGPPPRRPRAGAAQHGGGLHPPRLRRVGPRRPHRRRQPHLVRRDEATAGAGRASSPASPAARRCARRSASPRRMQSGDIVVLLADGGWKYLSTGLWGRDYDDIAGDETIEGQLWW